MKIRMLKSLAGPQYAANYGEVIDYLPKSLCVKLIRKGLAVEVDPPVFAAPAESGDSGRDGRTSFDAFLDRPAKAVIADLSAQSAGALRTIRLEEQRGKARKTVLAAIEQAIGGAPA